MTLEVHMTGAGTVAVANKKIVDEVSTTNLLLHNGVLSLSLTLSLSLSLSVLIFRDFFLSILEHFLFCAIRLHLSSLLLEISNVKIVNRISPQGHGMLWSK